MLSRGQSWLLKKLLKLISLDGVVPSLLCHPSTLRLRLEEPPSGDHMIGLNNAEMKSSDIECSLLCFSDHGIITDRFGNVLYYLKGFGVKLKVSLIHR